MKKKKKYSPDEIFDIVDGAARGDEIAIQLTDRVFVVDGPGALPKGGVPETKFTFIGNEVTSDDIIDADSDSEFPENEEPTWYGDCQPQKRITADKCVVVSEEQV